MCVVIMMQALRVLRMIAYSFSVYRGAEPNILSPYRDARKNGRSYVLGPIARRLVRLVLAMGGMPSLRDIALCLGNLSAIPA